MRTIISHIFFKTVVILCFLTTLNLRGQNKNTGNKTLFGQKIRPASINPKNGKIRCATVEYEKYLQKKNPNRMTEAQFETWVAPLVNNQTNKRTRSQSGGIITIPVVVHVIYSGQSVGVAPNITDAQVQSQITVLNQDFRKMTGTPGYNINSVGADVEIEFALAKVDPNDNPTNGIDRVSFCQKSWSENELNTIVQPSTIWDPTQYMNMWTVEFEDDLDLGFAQFPEASGLSGLSSGGEANTDGVVSLYSVFGSNTYDDGSFLLISNYDKGRTMTHEVGHWLGLRHIWGDGTGNGKQAKNPDCTATDYCDDTPQVGYEHYDCDITYDTCPSSGNDMPENYMDYTTDACMNIFTLNQKDRMTTIINNAARRSSLKTSTKNAAIPLFANDAEIKLETNCAVPTCGVLSNQTIQKILIYNRGTSNLTSATINYSINGGSAISYNWTGDLASNKMGVISITINATSNGTIAATIASVNGVADQRTTNNSVSGSFAIPTAAPSYSTSNYVFRLQQDLWGGETTWNIKNNSGTILYSGGPYTNKEEGSLPALITQNWTLANNNCYTFTINDSESDGLCCAGGNGYYDIKTSGGVSIASGTSFYSSENSVFAIDTLSVADIESFDNVVIYPNPTKTILNIQVPSNFGLPNRYIINNTLGQLIGENEISKASDLTINTSALSNGVYFITIFKENHEKTFKFIKE